VSGPPTGLTWPSYTDPLHPSANVDMALMNFMADWFPVESREKLRSNEQEANTELAQQFGLDQGGCLVL
jgi:hypothetical protein